ncbi:MAG TPA: chaperone modulator CbpM [Saprospiraceae bacterium]|nr:chaperone modulator CbpM [Saprospiraceae bacterium]HPN68840.1 chaperone modulator CbpM [Saprospiraceae bacterium]
MSIERQFIEIQKLCTIYDVTPDLLIALEEHDLISIAYTEEAILLDVDELGKFEQWMRLHYDLGINIPGLAVIQDLLEERENLRQELAHLRSKI